MTTVDALSNTFRTMAPEDCVDDHELDPHLASLADVHRRYAEVTSCDAMIAYLERVRRSAAA